MTESLTHEVIAIDGGGTRCRVALHDGRTTTTVETGSANVSTDFDGAVREILAGLDALALRSGRSAQNLLHLPTFLGLAGVTGTKIAQRLRAALPLHNVRIEDDRPAALRGALGAADGVIAHCGTGSFYAAQKGTEMRFAGGWGPVLGDEASAQWIGRAVLRMTLECVDGRAQVSPLAERMLDDLGGSAGVVSFAGSARPTDFGALAPLVTGYAEQGDLIACAVMQDGADHIARSLPKVGWGDGQPICLTGGIGPHFARFLPAEMQAALSDPVGEPLSGAISLARGLALETADERR